MQNLESIKELLRMAHEQLDSQAAENDALKVRVAALEQALKVAGISIDAPKNNISSEGDFWAGLEESLNNEDKS